MKLYIDNREIEARADQSLLDMLTEMGLMTGKLSEDPIAAKIAGRVFTLNYVPVRQKDLAPDRKSIRTAMAASGGVINLIRYTDPIGHDVYTRTAQFIVFLAIRRLWPKAQGTMNCTIGSGLYFKVTGVEDFSAEVLEAEIDRIVLEDIKLNRRRMPTKDLIEYYKSIGEDDKATLLTYRKKERIDVYENDGFLDYFYGEMAPSTGFLRSWDIIPAPEGFIFIYPDRKNPDRVSPYKESPNFFQMSAESKEWSELMECETVADLNELVASGKIRELIRVNEALHE